MSRRLPTHLLWILLWCAAWAGLGVHGATLEAPPSLDGVLTPWGPVARESLGATRAAFALLAGWQLVLGLALWSLRPWARWAGGVTFLALGAGSVALPRLLDPHGGWLGDGASRSLRLSLVVGNLWAAGYLCSPSTRELFRGGGFARIGLQTLAAPALLLLGATAIALLDLARGPTLALAALLVLGGLAVEQRLNAWLAVYLAPRPLELDREAWSSFREARRARLRGDLHACEAILGRLPLELQQGSRAVRILRGLAALDRARRGPTSAAGAYAALILLGDDEERSRSGDAALAAWIEAAPLGELTWPLEQRAQLVDALLEDAADPRSCFALELSAALGEITGEHFAANGEQGYRRWWSERRASQRELRWVVARAWRGERHTSAQAIARRATTDLPGEGGPVSDAQLIAAAELARCFGEASRRLTEPAWRDQEHDRLALAVGLADGMGWMLLESPYLERGGVVRAGQRFAERRALISTVRALWEAYPEDAGATARWLLNLLTDAPARALRRRLRFDRYWSRRGPRQEEHERAFLAGLRAAAESMWEVAAQSFARAVELAPERTSPLYNQAHALLELERYQDAEALLRELTRREPDEPFWWLRLGDCLRQGGDLQAALRAYRQAVEHEGLGGRVALRLGLALVADGQEQAATRYLDAALEQVDEPELTEQLAAVLESEGAFDLARRYHHRAFLQQLERGVEWTGTEEEGDEPELV
ncbi:MAG: tetratricopeptide repeat protein [Planctomycetota bacterium]